MRTFILLSGMAIVAGCATDAEVSENPMLDGYSVIGTLPEDADVDALVSDMSEGSMMIVGHPDSSDVGMILSEGSSLARIASDDWSMSGGPACLDCGTGCTAGVSTRTIRFTMSHDQGVAAEEFSLLRTYSANFSNSTVSPASFSAPIGNTVTIDVTGTINNCSATFGYDFDVQGEQVVFATSTVHNGNLGGAAGGDAICNTRATAAGFSGNFKAWLGTSSSSAAARMTGYTTNYILPDGTTVANNFTDLTDGSLDIRINRNELNAAVGNTNVWTGANGSGVATANTCTDWTTSSSTIRGTIGRTDRVDNGWSNYNVHYCNQTRRLYCVQQ